MRKLQLVPPNTRFRFMRHSRWSLPLSVVLALLSFSLLFTRGLDLGIDFLGGTLIEVTTPGPPDVADIRARLGGLELGDTQVNVATEFTGQQFVEIRVQPSEDQASQDRLVPQVMGALGEGVELRSSETVGPRVSGELSRAGTIAVIVALFGILIYVWFRFEWQFAVGAVLTTIHDVALTIGLYSILQLDFDLSSIAAILTIVGYSLNDTVVIYDRIRDNLRRFKKMPLSELLDASVNQTLSRTAMTGVTTLLALASLYFFGGEVIRSFTLAMIFGVLIGTYSSVFLAAPLLIYLGLRPNTGDAVPAAGGSRKKQDEPAKAQP